MSKTLKFAYSELYLFWLKVYEIYSQKSESL